MEREIPSLDTITISSPRWRKSRKRVNPSSAYVKGCNSSMSITGGTLKQDVDESTYHFQPERGYEKIDEIQIEGDESFLGKLYASKKLKINSIHHQAVETLGA
jgi:gamma-glutamyl-gamma-aminobutyrate hydrolase PuuD